jgi:hypothetical protein
VELEINPASSALQRRPDQNNQTPFDFPCNIPSTFEPSQYPRKRIYEASRSGIPSKRSRSSFPDTSNDCDMNVRLKLDTDSDKHSSVIQCNDSDDSNDCGIKKEIDSVNDVAYDSDDTPEIIDEHSPSLTVGFKSSDLGSAEFNGLVLAESNVLRNGASCNLRYSFDSVDADSHLAVTPSSSQTLLTVPIKTLEKLRALQSMIPEDVLEKNSIGFKLFNRRVPRSGRPC